MDIDIDTKKFLAWDRYKGYLVNGVQLVLLCILAILVQKTQDPSLQILYSFLFGMVFFALVAHASLREYAFRHEKSLTTTTTTTTTTTPQGGAPLAESSSPPAPPPPPPPSVLPPPPPPLSTDTRLPPPVQPKQANPRAFYDGCVSKTGRRGPVVTSQRGYGNYIPQPM